MKELVNQLALLIKEPLERARIAQQAAQVADQYTWQRTADYTLEQIKEVINERVISTY